MIFCMVSVCNGSMGSDIGSPIKQGFNFSQSLFNEYTSARSYKEITNGSG